jgi:hypothetical protein
MNVYKINYFERDIDEIQTFTGSLIEWVKDCKGKIVTRVLAKKETV